MILWSSLVFLRSTKSPFKTLFKCMKISSFPVNRGARVCLNHELWWYKTSSTKLHSTQLHFAPQFFFNSPCFQYILRNKRSNIWELSIGLNFSLTRNDEKSDFWCWKWGVDLYTGLAYTRINAVMNFSQTSTCAESDAYFKSFWNPCTCIFCSQGFCM